MSPLSPLYYAGFIAAMAVGMLAGILYWTRVRKRTLEQILDALPLPLVVQDASGTIRYTSAAVQDYGGAGHLAELLGDAEVAGDLREIAVRGLDRECRLLAVRGSTARTEWGGLTIGVAMDVSGRRHLEDELRRSEKRCRALEKAVESAPRARSEFLSAIGSQVGTPVNAILNMAELALDMDPKSGQRESIEAIKSSAERVLAVLSDMSSIEVETIAPLSSPFQLRETLNALFKPLAIRAAGKGLGFASSVDEGVPDLLAGDASGLRQVILNLAGNAIKFTEAGGVVVQVGAACPEGDGRLWLEVSVTDTGAGIPSEGQAAIFTPPDNRSAGRHNRPGFGLPVAARLVQRMGGTIRLDSQPDSGSTFSFRVPMRAPSGDGAHLQTLKTTQAHDLLRSADEVPRMKFQNDLATLNRAVALERVGGDEQLLGEIAALFLEESVKLLDDLRAAVANRDAYRIERTAHSLKGSVSNFGADVAYRAALELEMAGRNKSLDVAPGALRDLEAALESLRPLLLDIQAAA